MSKTFKRHNIQCSPNILREINYHHNSYIMVISRKDFNETNDIVLGMYSVLLQTFQTLRNNTLISPPLRAPVLLFARPEGWFGN